MSLSGGASDFHTNPPSCGILLLTLVLLSALVAFLFCVAEGNCPRVARREEPHVAPLGVIAGSGSDGVISGSARDHRFRALVATSTSARGPRGRFTVVQVTPAELQEEIDRE
jgi:hypothetical protein